MAKTIKDLADELGVKKHIVKYQVEKLPEEYVENYSGTIYINEYGIAIITEKLSGETTEEKSHNELLVNHLLKEVEHKNSQITEFQKLLEIQQKLLDQQQVLTLQANKKIAELETTTTDSSETHEEPHSKKQGFWSRFFH